MDENPYDSERPSHLADIWDVTQERKRAEADAESRYIAWCALIAKAVEGGHRVTDVAKAAQCSRERVYQILALVEAGKETLQVDVNGRTVAFTVPEAAKALGVSEEFIRRSSS